MVERQLSDGKRIAQLLASEIDGLGGPLEPATVVDAEPDVEPTVDGAFAYAVAVTPERSTSEIATHESDEGSAEGTSEPGDRIATVFVQPDRARIEFTVGHQQIAVDDQQIAAEQQQVAEAASDAGLRVRPKASHPPQTLVFVESGAEVKRAVSVFESVLQRHE